MSVINTAARPKAFDLKQYRLNELLTGLQLLDPTRRQLLEDDIERAIEEQRAAKV